MLPNRWHDVLVWEWTVLDSLGDAARQVRAQLVFATIVGNGGGVARGIGVGAGVASFGVTVAAVADSLDGPLSSAFSRSPNFLIVASSVRTLLAFVMERRIGAMSAIKPSRTRKAINPSI